MRRINGKYGFSTSMCMGESGRSAQTSRTRIMGATYLNLLLIKLKRELHRTIESVMGLGPKLGIRTNIVIKR